MIVLIGDAHGKTKQLLRKVKQYDPHPTFQLGDMGIGFSGVGFGKQRDTFKWFRGNHDDPGKCHTYHNYLGDYGTLEVEGRRIFYLAGAYSIDFKWRESGVTWWPDEQLSTAELDKARVLYAEYKPDLVLSHECPSDIAKMLLKDLIMDGDRNAQYFNAKFGCVYSRTAETLQQMFEAHPPKDWVFGHYHVDKDMEINGTHFHCCAELSTYFLREEDRPGETVCIHNNNPIFCGECKYSPI